jgi:hypothetical protein
VAGRRAPCVVVGVRWHRVGTGVVVYRVAAGRGYADAAQVLGEDYAGVLERDGWAPYRRFAHARHMRGTRAAWRTCCAAAPS